MYIENTIQKLSIEEMQILQSLIGKTIQSISSADIEFRTDKKTYLFTNPINILCENGLRYVAFEYDFNETYYGDDFYTPKITLQSNAIGTSTIGSTAGNDRFFPGAGLTTNFARFEIKPDFTVKLIEVYGVESELDARSIIFGSDTNYLERIEKGEIPEREIISSESVFVFHSDDDRKMVIYGFFLPMMKVSLEESEIVEALKRINFENIEMTPKHILK